MNKYLTIWEPILRKFEEQYKTMRMSNGQSFDEKIIEWYPSGYAEITVTMSNGMMYAFNRIGSCITPVKNRRGVDDGCDEISKDETAWRENFSKRLRFKMRRQGISQGRLSKLTGISTVSLSKYMNGIASPSGYNLERLSRALQCSVSELISAY